MGMDFVSPELYEKRKEHFKSIVSPQERIKRTLGYLDSLPETPEYQKIRELLSSETD